MLFTVTTARDTPANLERFVARNLAAGVDHMLVFLDAADPAAEELLAGHPQVTTVVTDERYWQGSRPDDLNVRQVLNSNLVNGLLASFAWATWLFHIDADEVLQIDRDRLLAEVPPTEPLVVLDPLEAVSRRRWDGEVTHFKRLLTDEELQLLAALGLVQRPDNRDYFRGHIAGKLGVRPSLDLRLQLHRAYTEGTEPLRPFRAEWLRLRHYESFDGEEFVRKWMAHVSAGRVRFRPNRERLLAALHALVGIEMAPEKRHEYLMRLYSRWVEDDFDTLEDLGLLVQPPAGSHVPEPLPDEARREMEQLLALLVSADKRHIQEEVRPARAATPE